MRAARVAGALALLASAGASSAAAAPYRPTDDRLVLERLPAGLPARAAPRQDPVLAADVARGHVERSRRDADPRFLGYAQAALAPWWNEREPPVPVLLLRATIRQARHDFEGALSDLGQLLAREPAQPQALLTRATLLRVQGRFAESMADCRALRPLADAFYATVCEAAALGLSGQARRAAALLDAAGADGHGAAARAWWTAERADLARRLGEAETALRLYRTAIIAGYADPLMLGAAAQLLLDLGRPAEALELIGPDPQADLLRLRRAQALRALNRPDSRLESGLAAGYEAARRRGDSVHLREEARFELSVRGDARTALTLARDNWAEQREPEDARVLLEAAAQSGDRDAITLVRDWQRDTGLEDRDLQRRVEASGS